MKLSKYLFIFFLLISVLCQAQTDSLNLTIEYQPNKTYNKIENNSITIEIRFLKNKKLKNKPQIQQIQETTKYLLTTESPTDDRKIPFSLNIKNEKDPVINNIIFKGNYKDGEYPKITSLESSSLTLSQRETFSKLIQESLKQTLLINKKLKIGDSFTTTTPFKYPGDDFSEMTLTTTYTLKEIKDGKAYFDYIQNYNLSMSTYNTSASGKGSGKGQFIYGLSEHFCLSDVVASSLEVETTIEGQPVSLKMNINTEIKNTVL